MKRVNFIINPNAGQLKGRGALCELLTVFSSPHSCKWLKTSSKDEGEERTSFDATVHITNARGDAERYVREFCTDSELIAVCGGDGTLNEVINGIAGFDNPPPIGYIPAGTTNDFASSVGLFGDPVKAAQAIFDGDEHKIDIGGFNDRRFVYIASFGAFTGSSYTAPQELKNSIGHIAYVYEGLRDLPNIHPIHMRITANGAIYEGDYVFGAISNSTSIGGIVKLAPNTVKLDDGLFELVMVKNPSSMAEMHELVTAVKTGDLDSCSLITMFKSGDALLTGDVTPWSLDGEYCKGAEQIRIRNFNHALRLIY